MKKNLCRVFVMLLMFSFLVGCGDSAVTLTSTSTSTATSTAQSFTAYIDGAQEVPAVPTNANGTAVFSLNATKTELSYDITVTGLSGAITSAHFHNAAAGANGTIVRTIVFTGNSASGVWKNTDATPLTAALVSQLESGGIYINVHTGANPNGEIRGNILIGPYGNKVFTAKLAGSQEVPPVATTAVGTGSFILYSKNELQFHITVTGLSGTITSAHFHNAAAGSNSVGFLLPITFVGDQVLGVWKSTDATPLTPALVSQLEAGALYVNVHTSANTGGEIRGQVIVDP